MGCGFEGTKVLESRESRDGLSVRRRRECLRCGMRMTTFERMEEVSIYVVKRNGNREIFSKDKLLKSLELAFRKRNLSPDVIEEIASGVERRVRESGAREISTSEIGDVVLSGLRDVDPVAYVRFASVYRAFSTAEDFVRELQLLESTIREKNPIRDPARFNHQASDESLHGSDLDL
jgi:transcriptional repressor NrdR